MQCFKRTYERVARKTKTRKTKTRKTKTLVFFLGKSSNFTALTVYSILATVACSRHSVYSWGAVRKTGREKKKNAARRYGKRNYFRLSQRGVTLCTKVCEKTNEVKQCFVYFAKRYFSPEKVLCVFRFVTSILSLERITLKLLTNKYSFISS